MKITAMQPQGGPGVQPLFGAHITLKRCAPLSNTVYIYILQDVDSECEVRVDGEPLQKGAKTRVKPGSVVSCGQDVAYQVVGWVGGWLAEGEGRLMQRESPTQSFSERGRLRGSA